MLQHQEQVGNGNGVPVSISVSMAAVDAANASIDPSLRPGAQTPLINNHNGNIANGNGMRYTNGHQSPTPTHYAPKSSPRMRGGKGVMEEEERRREERREELRREMERIRAELRGKEREFEELGGMDD